LDKRIKRLKLTKRWSTDAEGRTLRLYGDFLIASAAITNPPPRPKKIAVIDIGSNTVRIEIYDCTRLPPKLLYEDGEACALGSDMSPNDKDPKLSEKGKTETLKLLKKFRKNIKSFDVDTVVAVGTEALRAVQHTPEGKAFLKEAEEALGHPINVINKNEEALLTGKATLYAHHNANGIVIGMGGASTEVLKMKNGKVIKHKTLRIGTLSSLKASEGDVTVAAEITLEHLRTIPWFPNGRNRLTQRKGLYFVGGSYRGTARLELTRAHEGINLDSPFLGGGPTLIYGNEKEHEALEFLSKMNARDIRTYVNLLAVRKFGKEEFLGDEEETLTKKVGLKDLRKWRKSDNYSDWTSSDDYKAWRKSDQYKVWKRRIISRDRLIPLVAKSVQSLCKHLQPHEITICKQGLREAVVGLEIG